ncbi:hypothetical protein MCEET85_00851 [Candidatus Methylopumilus planktonicus]|uniref:hypothetical protein n=1 Tax=Candidatus Methylopumilus planktonicus TaxID=1581557 RepID=UPI003BEF3725
MGLILTDAEIIIKELIKAKPKTHKLLFLGDVKILFSQQEFLNLTNKLGFSAKHKALEMNEEFSAHSFGNSLGFSVVNTLDINGKADYKIDITKKIPQHFIGKYDFIIDCGVLFYCFNPGMALCNLARITSKNGRVIHITAITGHYGRGLYCIHPFTLINFYKKNNFEHVSSYYRKKTDLHLIGFCCQYIKAGLIKFISYFLPNKFFFFTKNHKLLIDFELNFIEGSSNFIPNNVVGILIFKKSNKAPKKINNLFLLT